VHYSSQFANKLTLLPFCLTLSLGYCERLGLWIGVGLKGGTMETENGNEEIEEYYRVQHVKYFSLHAMECTTYLAVRRESLVHYMRK